MTHRNAPLTVEGRRRLIERCQSRPIAHVAAEMGISRQCASTWVNRHRKYGDLGLQDRSSAPKHQPTATAAEVVADIESTGATDANGAVNAISGLAIWNVRPMPRCARACGGSSLTRLR